MKKNETFISTCESYTYDGLGVVRNQDMVFFVPNLIVGEKAEISIESLKKNYGYGRVVNIIEESSHRIKPQCDVFKPCGGCQIMHMDTYAQHNFKEEKVKNCFLQNAKMDVDVFPILASEEVYGYRNKVQVPVQYKNGQVLMGFYRKHTNDIIPYDKCLVQSELSNRIIASFRQWLTELKNASDFRYVLVKHAQHTGEAMICMVVRNYPIRNMDKLTKNILDTYPEVKSLIALVNKREDNVILDGNEHVLFGNAYIEEELMGCTFQISARSFFQVNSYTTPILYQTAVDYAGLTGKETVIDLYCGTGTIGMICAKKAKKVYGIEIVEDAIKDARKNAKRNNIDNIDFFVADANVGAQRLLKSKIKADVVIVDPPRKGCTKDTLDAIVKIGPDRIVYVSCDPATLARDCAILDEKGYKVEKVQPVDMFPHTQHGETVVLISRKDNNLGE